MKSLRLGQDVVLSWPSGAADCRVIAAAGAFVLLRPDRGDDFQDGIPGPCTLTFLDGMIPMGWDGHIDFGSEPGELRFRLQDPSIGAERRSSVRLPVFVEVMVATGEVETRGQMLDLSAGGMRFRGTGEHPVDSIVRVFTQLPNGPAIDAHGNVRMSQPGGVVAIEFTAFHVGSAQEIGAWTVGQLRQSLARV
jgi:PilZ domain